MPQYGDSHQIVKEQLPCINLLSSLMCILPRGSCFVDVDLSTLLPDIPLDPILFHFFFHKQIIDYSIRLLKNIVCT